MDNASSAIAFNLACKKQVESYALLCDKIVIMNRKTGRIITRRDFLKKTAAGAFLAYAGINASTLIRGRGTFAQVSDQFRVVKVHNAAMGGTLVNGWSSQNSAINASVVRTSLDQALTCLTGTGTPQNGWAQIVPATPARNEAVVAIKLNFISSNLAPHTAVASWIIDGLREVGVQASNIYLYDERDLTALYSDLGSPTGIHYLNSGRNSTYYNIAGHIVRLNNLLHNDTADWIINVGVPKSHGTDYGSFTMLMKNHYGSWSPIHAPDAYLASINAHSKVLPRTILNIMDCIYGSCSGGPGGVTSHMPNQIFMGKSSLAVDYLVAKHLLEPPESSGGMNMPINWLRINNWPLEGNFGITQSELQNLALITDCSGDNVRPKAPTNLVVTPT